MEQVLEFNTKKEYTIPPSKGESSVPEAKLRNEQGDVFGGRNPPFRVIANLSKNLSLFHNINQS